MIPKIIHYCWFGGNPLPDIAQKCILSWKKYLPDYEIKEWNESNFDVNCCQYVKEAYEEKKWAFVSDYARFQILYREGGLYFDTDVEIIKSFDSILNKGAFMGCEFVNNTGINEVGVNPGLGLGTAAGNPLYREMLDCYENAHFIKLDGTIDYTTIVDRATILCEKYGFEKNVNVQNIKGINIYPPEYFCPMDYGTGKLNITENTYSIHWYDASWLDDKMKKRRKKSEKIRNLCKGKLGMKLSKVYMSGSYFAEWVVTGQWETISCKLKRKIRRK